MEFEEVQNLIRREDHHHSPLLVDGFLEPASPIITTNAYDSLIHNQQQQQTMVVRKPTFSDFVHRLKQQSSKTRFVRDYKKMAHNGPDDDNNVYSTEEDNASIRIIDPTRSSPFTRDSEEMILDVSSDDDYNMTSEMMIHRLGIREREKKPMKKVKINESANQQIKLDTDTIASSSFEIPEGNLTSVDRFVTFDVAIGLINQDISDKTDEIFKQMKRIEINKDEITRYKQDLLNMQKQLDFFHYSLSSLKSDHSLQDMLTHQTNALKNTETLRENRKRNALLKSRFDRYRKAISIDTRLSELEKKIRAAWRRDEIWAGIRDWGFLSVLLITLVITSFVAWQS